MKSFFKTSAGIGIATFVIAIILIALFRAFGVTVDALPFVPGGQLQLTSLPDNAQVLLDDDIVTADSETGTFTDISKGEHTVLVFAENFWPWAKNISIERNQTESFAPFLISKQTSGVIITQNDPEYVQLVTRIKNETLPTGDNPLLSESKNVSVYSDGTSITAHWLNEASSTPHFFCDKENVCENTTTIFSGDNPIRNIAFYKDREDLLLIAVEDGVFAIELDRRGGIQNFQPVYKGSNKPLFSIQNEFGLYVLDGQNLFIVTI